MLDIRGHMDNWLKKCAQGVGKLHKALAKSPGYDRCINKIQGNIVNIPIFQVNQNC